GPYQPVRGLVPGETVTASVDIQGGQAGHTWAVELWDARGARLGQAAAELSDSSMSTLSFTTVLPDFLPGDFVTFRVVNRMIVQSSAFWDNARLIRGLPAATATEIIRHLVEAAQGRGTFEFLHLDFTDSEDSAGTSVSPISFTVAAGQHL